jgi:indole-3-glycerol phosphate synthase
MAPGRPAHVATYLDRILAAHRARARADDRSLAPLVAEARAQSVPRGFVAALRAAAGAATGVEGAAAGGSGTIAVIAEVKRRSPSKGDLAPALDPAELARTYERGGATCLSVLTDTEFFGGSPDDLRAARAATQLPVLRKDFTVSPADVCDTRIMGADAVLLIAAALDDDELSELHTLALDVGLDALVEVHDEEELERALAIDAHLVGVNQRDLVTFEVDRERAARVGRALPATVVRVAESGITGPDDAAALAAAGFDAVLVGELLVTSGDPEAAVRLLRGLGT